MIKSILRRLVLLWVIGLMMTGLAAASKNARLNNMTVTNNRDTLLFYVELNEAFDDDIMTALESGVTLSFSFPISVRRDRRLWFDKKITLIKLIHTIKFDTLKKDYTVTRSWQSPQSQTVKSLDEAIMLMTRIDGFPLLPLALLKKGESYRVTAQARLNKISRPSYLKYVLFFLNTWKFKTKRSYVDFIY